MTLTVWRNVFHTLIGVIGFTALIAIMTGANVDGRTQGLTQSQKEGDVCMIKEGRDDHGERFTYVQR